MYGSDPVTDVSLVVKRHWRTISPQRPEHVCCPLSGACSQLVMSPQPPFRHPRRPVKRWRESLRCPDGLALDQVWPPPAACKVKPCRSQVDRYTLCTLFHSKHAQKYGVHSTRTLETIELVWICGTTSVSGNSCASRDVPSILRLSSPFLFPFLSEISTLPIEFFGCTEYVLYGDLRPLSVQCSLGASYLTYHIFARNIVYIR